MCIKRDGIMLFIALVRQMMREVSQDLQVPVMGPQIQLLELLEQRGPLKMTDLASELDISLGGATALGDRMVKAELVDRRRLDSDRRVIQLVPTDRGKQLLQDISQARQKVVARYFGRLSDEEFQQMESFCRRMLEETRD